MLQTLILAALLIPISWVAIKIYLEISRSLSEDPAVWESTIRAFENAARKRPPPRDAVVFTGSSSIRFWKSLERDMHPLDVINRGFGGAKLGDVASYARRLVSPCEPRAVVVFAGTNDIRPKASKAPEVLLQTYTRFVAEVRKDLPRVPIFYVAITPSPLRWEIWPIAQATNALIEEYCEQTEGLFFIDTGPALLDERGLPDPGNYRRIDRLHPSAKGYRIWTEIIRKVLTTHFGESA